MIRNTIPNHGNCLGGASLRTQGVQRSKRFIAVLKTQMKKLEIFVSCTTPTFPKRIPPNPNFKADNISSRPNPHFRVGNICLPQTQISKLKKHFTQDHIWKLEGFVLSTNPNFKVGSIRLSIRARLLRLVVLQKLRFQCLVVESPNFNDGSMSCLFKTHFSKFNIFVANARPKFQS